MSRSPLVSIITVVFNGVCFIEDTIQSVLGQTYENIEYIIVDGGSTDGTLEVIRKYQDQIAKWVSEPDKGIYDAMNKGIGMASGDLIGILNADDYYSLETVSKVVERYLETDCHILHGEMKLTDPDDGSLVEHRKPKPQKLYFDMYVNHPTVFLSKSLYQKRKFDANFRYAADYELMLYAKLNGYKFQQINEVLTFMRVGGVSEVNYAATKKEVDVAKRRHLHLLVYFAVRFISFVSQLRRRKK